MNRNSLDDEFNLFLAEVDKLSIQPGEISTVCPLAPESIDSKRSNHCSKEDKNARRKEKQRMIKNADENQRAWANFTKLELPRNETAVPSADAGKPKISFQIQSGKSKAKKKTKSMRHLETNEVSDEPTDQNNQNKTIIENNNPNSLWAQCPSWTLVIDTSSLLNDNGMKVKQLISLARDVSLILSRFQSQRFEQTYSSSNPIVEEPLLILIPYKVWKELEYQSKSENSSLAFSARTVTRMLKDELSQQNINQSKVLESIGPANVVSSQTLKQSQNAAKRFVSHDLVVTASNDDHIIACALVEQEKLTPTSENISGGVVMITCDNNMGCKALSNGLKVFSPHDFHAYYLKRMESLRQRMKKV